MNPVGFVIVAAAVIAVVLAFAFAGIESAVAGFAAAAAVSSILWLLYVALSPKRGDR